MKTSKKTELLKNAGKSIEKFRTLKGLTIVELANKSKINISIVENICSGKITPTKEEVKALSKSMGISKELILLYSITDKHVSPNKKEIFNTLIPSIKGLIEQVMTDDTKDKKKEAKKAKKATKVSTVKKVTKTKSKNKK